MFFKDKKRQKVVEDIYEKLNDRVVRDDSLVSNDSYMNHYNKFDVRTKLFGIRASRFHFSKTTLIGIKIYNYSCYEYKAIIDYKCDGTDRKIYLTVGKDNKITNISEKDFN